MLSKEQERKISILDWGIIVSAILLLLTVYLPQSIWKEEVKFRKLGRHRMTSIAHAEEFYLSYSFNIGENHIEIMFSDAKRGEFTDSMRLDQFMTLTTS